MGQKFYRTAEMPPPLGVKVWAIWDGRGPFLVARIRHPRSGREVWAADHDGEQVFLPVPKSRPADPDRPWIGWHTLKNDAPEYWAPTKPELWGLPMPPPAFERQAGPAKMWTAKQAFSATDAAAEMEADRETARNVPRETEPRGGRVTEQWWRDISLIKYEPATALTLRMAEGRVMRAVACCGAGRGLTLAVPEVSGVLSAIAEAMARAGDYAVTDYVPRLEPLPADETDFVEAMRWFTLLNPPELWAAGRKAWAMSRPQNILIWRALPIPWSFDEIGEKLNLSGERARQINGKALETCWRAGAGVAKPGRDHIGDLQERNRRYKRNAAAVL